MVEYMWKKPVVDGKESKMYDSGLYYATKD